MSRVQGVVHWVLGLYLLGSFSEAYPGTLFAYGLMGSTNPEP